MSRNNSNSDAFMKAGGWIFIGGCVALFMSPGAFVLGVLGATLFGIIGLKIR